jgi:sodium/bile acid cotransporter 7
MKRPRAGSSPGDWFLLGMIAAVGLAWLLPAPGARGGVLHPELTTKLGIALIFFLHGLMLSFRALAQGTRKWQLHLLVHLSTFGLFPVLGWVLVSVLGSRLSQELRTGLFFLCALPSTVSSSVALTATAGGDVAAAVFDATLSSLLGVVLTPLWLSWVVGTAGHALPFGDVVLELLKYLLAPLVLGQLLRPLLGRLAERHKSGINVVDRLTILLLVYTSFCDSVVEGVWKSGAATLVVSTAASVVLLAVLLLSTWFTARALGLPREDRIVALFCGSKKSLAQGVPMARVIFGAAPQLAVVLLPIMIYHPLQLVVGGWLAGRFARSGAQQ